MKRLVLAVHGTSDPGVGDLRVSIQAARAKGERFEPLRALVDTGSTFTWVPRDVLERLGVSPEQEWPFELADGREQRYPVAWVQIKVEESRAQPTIVEYAQPGSGAI